MQTQNSIPQDVQGHSLIHDGKQHELKTKLEINMGDEKMIINHAFTGTRTIREIYDDFLIRKIESV